VRRTVDFQSQVPDSQKLSNPKREHQILVMMTIENSSESAFGNNLGTGQMGSDGNYGNNLGTLGNKKADFRRLFCFCYDLPPRGRFFQIAQ
jgi:hypothetical protein